MYRDQRPSGFDTFLFFLVILAFIATVVITGLYFLGVGR